MRQTVKGYQEGAGAGVRCKLNRERKPTIEATSARATRRLSSKVIGTRPYNTQPHNTQPYNTQPYNTQPYKTQPYNTQPYNTQPYNTQHSVGPKRLMNLQSSREDSRRLCTSQLHEPTDKQTSLDDIGMPARRYGGSWSISLPLASTNIADETERTLAHDLANIFCAIIPDSLRQCPFSTDVADFFNCTVLLASSTWFDDIHPGKHQLRPPQCQKATETDTNGVDALRRRRRSQN
ncbi:uncharacterized protein M421DRAFT_96572 [Didymella exigua CBS 183.55]|uniref:Uncharacterized protein n=1 Tax=Didymella exigua CBS 183.55 TaxID=1150837 RepID=A0A6A5R5Y6_9PLEO|nr:uncharacterized protein M421DRAFT_96572 [Didymella exigua CBS 183.55]KAF1922799.1 hypothetical protein M421DRAFT_96572 [Didymella exigua CBS 183.55]